MNTKNAVYFLVQRQPSPIKLVLLVTIDSLFGLVVIQFFQKEKNSLKDFSDFLHEVKGL